ncbi:MAG: carboxypeptidase-like regulatory domain-containing protein [Armatimonadota bacterium]|nr:carboxypeptidase-like regulatory domain-containing protein [Armatimonadota bacterium]
METRTRIPALVLAVAGIVLAASAAQCQSYALLQWSVQCNEDQYLGNYVIRDFDVDQSNGDIWIAMDANAATGPVSQVVRMDKNGNVVARYGPILCDSNGTQQADLQQSLWGVARDPKTGYVYLGVDEVVDGVSVGTIHIIDPNLTPPNVWVGKISTGMRTARGCSFSDDGMKFAIAGYYTQSPGRSGAKLYVRNLQGTPDNWTDDTWDVAAELMSGKGFRGLGDYMGFVSSPRTAEFDRDGNLWVCGEVSNIIYSTTPPYSIVGEMCAYTPRYATAFDAQNNVYTTANTDADNKRRVWVQDPNGVVLLKFVPRDLMSYIDIPYSCAFDRGGPDRPARLIVGGRDVNAQYAVVDSYEVYLETPQTYTLSGRVVDSSGQPISDAAVGCAQWFGNTTWVTRLVGKKSYKKAVDEQGRFSIPVLPADSVNPFVVEIEAPGKLCKRLYIDPISQDIDLGDIVLDSNSVSSITWYPLNIAPGTTGTAMVERRGTDNGILTCAFRYGGRAAPVRDADSNNELCFRIGNRTDANPPGGKAYDNYLYLDIDDNWWTPGGDAWVTIEYLDKSKGSPGGFDALGFDADLSGISASLREAPIAKFYKISPTTGEWKKKTFKVSKASFAGMMRDTNGVPIGADIRIDAFKDYSGGYLANTGPDWIKSVTISKTPPEPEPNTYASIAEAKAVGTGPVVLESKVVTAQWNGNVIYLSEPDRSSAIRAELFQPWATSAYVGREWKIYGSLDSDPNTGEPLIRATGWAQDPGTAHTVGPLGMIGSTAASVTTGAPVTGLKMEVWGLVKSVATDSFLINDGSQDVKVVIEPSISLTAWPSVGDYVAVVGIATLESRESRIVKPWRAADVLIVLDVP